MIGYLFCDRHRRLGPEHARWAGASPSSTSCSGSGIGHAGTLISAILFLFRQKWRTSINRFAEAMTIFAVICAGIFPAIHVGPASGCSTGSSRIPNQMTIWPQLPQPAALGRVRGRHLRHVSLLFWYMGMMPDLATLRDRATNKIRRLHLRLPRRSAGAARTGTGTATRWPTCSWPRLATPLVLLGALGGVSFDFAVAQLPGWHTTIFPPYFVAGAIFSASPWC